MANAAVASWTACVKELQELAAAPSVAQRDGNAVLQRVEKLQDQPPLPHAAWKRLAQDVQVTGKLAKLCVQNLQQPGRPPLSSVLAFTVISVWLDKAVGTMKASPGSRAAAAVRQQLQDSQLLQHLGPAMEAAAARLTAAVAALAAAASTSTSSSSDGGSTAAPATTQQDSIEEQMSLVQKADVYCGLLLQAFYWASSAVSQSLRSGTLFCIEAALPAAPAAVRLILAGFQACSRLQQLMQQQLPQEQVPLNFRSLGAVGSSFLSNYGCLPVLLASVLPAAVTSDVMRSCPAARELLMSPDLASCLALVLVVTVLGLDMRGDVGGRAAPSSATSSSSDPSLGSRTGCQLQGTEGQQQQGARQGSRSGSDTGGGSGCGGSSGVRSKSLTALSCGFFDILGVSKQTAKEAARMLKSEGLTTVEAMYHVAAGYHRVVTYQVDQSKMAFNAQLLLLLETNLVLGLAVLQLTASIPNSHQEAQAARDLACQLANGASLHSLWSVAGLHKLPWPAAYTGPQLALQLLPSPFGPQQPTPVLPPQQQELPPPLQEQQPAEWCVLAPTAPLLAELLPLLTGRCLRQLQQPQPGMGQPPSSMPLEVRSCMMGLFILLLASVVPARGVAAAVDASAAAAIPHDGRVSCRCVLHAHDVFTVHASSIICSFEAVLRSEAAMCDAATAAAAIAAATAAAAGPASTGAAAAAVQGVGASDGGQVQTFAHFFCLLCYHDELGGYPHYLSPLLMLALAAGAGPKVLDQLHSLLATMVKISGWGVLESHVQLQYLSAAAHVASALLQSQQRQLAGAGGNSNAAAVGAVASAGESGCSSDHAAALTMLPSGVILGRCCMQYAKLLQEDPSLSQQQQKQQWQVVDFKSDFTHLLRTLQQWLQTGSTRKQVTAAGYVPLPLLQQLEQLVAAFMILQVSRSDTATVLEAANQLQSTGLAVCSFAVPCMCNNPSCTSWAGLSDLAAVSGCSCVCGGCRVARYCGRPCQRAAWKQHKPVCGALAAAAAVADVDGTEAVAAGQQRFE